MCSVTLIWWQNLCDLLVVDHCLTQKRYKANCLLIADCLHEYMAYPCIDACYWDWWLAIHVCSYMSALVHVAMMIHVLPLTISGNWQEELQQHISPDQLPQAYGGTRCEPDPRCTDYVSNYYITVFLQVQTWRCCYTFFMLSLIRSFLTQNFWH